VNAVSYEVEERYRRCGFEIEDTAAGQCRVLRHHVLGSRPFVGSVFTSAPLTHPVIASLASESPLDGTGDDDLLSDSDGDN